MAIISLAPNDGGLRALEPTNFSLGPVRSEQTRPSPPAPEVIDLSRLSSLAEAVERGRLVVARV